MEFDSIRKLLTLLEVNAFSNCSFLFIRPNVEVSKCKQLWKSTRDYFTKNLKEQKGLSGQKAMEKKKYKYFDQLLFLKDSLEPRNTDSNYQNLEDMSYDDLIVYSDPEQDENAGSSKACSPDIMPMYIEENTPSRVINVPNKKRKNDTLGGNGNLNSLIEQLLQHEEDDMDKFFLNLSAIAKSRKFTCEELIDFQCNMLADLKKRLREVSGA